MHGHTGNKITQSDCKCSTLSTLVGIVLAQSLQYAIGSQVKGEILKTPEQQCQVAAQFDKLADHYTQTPYEPLGGSQSPSPYTLMVQSVLSCIVK